MKTSQSFNLKSAKSLPALTLAPMYPAKYLPTISCKYKIMILNKENSLSLKNAKVLLRLCSPLSSFEYKKSYWEKIIEKLKWKNCLESYNVNTLM